MAPIFPMTLSLAGRRMRLTGHVTGWFIVGASAGSMLIPLLIGQAFSAIGPRFVIVVTTSTLAIAFGVLVLMIGNLKVRDEQS
jgi:fucose permease